MYDFCGPFKDRQLIRKLLNTIPNKLSIISKCKNAAQCGTGV